MERRRLRRGKPASMNHVSNFGGCSWTSWNEWSPVFFWFQRHLFHRKIVVKLSSKAALKTYLPCHHQQPSNNCCCQTLVPAPVASQSTILNVMIRGRLHYTCSHEISAHEAHEYRLYVYKCQCQHKYQKHRHVKANVVCFCDVLWPYITETGCQFRQFTGLHPVQCLRSLTINFFI